MEANDIKNMIPIEYQPFFKIISKPLISDAEKVADSFIKAIKIFAPNVRLVIPHVVFIGWTPFKCEIDAFEMEFRPKENVINFVAGDYVFIDASKIYSLPAELQIASIIEELVHAYMNVANEDLTKLIVCDIYDRVSFVDGRYVIVSR